MTIYDEYEGKNIKLCVLRVCIKKLFPENVSAYFQPLWIVVMRMYSFRRPGINFINILCSHFLYKSLLSGFSLLRVWFWMNFHMKNAHIKCWWNWHLIRESTDWINLDDTICVRFSKRKSFFSDQLEHPISLEDFPWIYPVDVSQFLLFLWKN